MRNSVLGARTRLGGSEERVSLGLTIMTEATAPSSERKHHADISAVQHPQLGSSRNNLQHYRTSKYSGVHFSTSKKRWLSEVANSGKKW